MDQDGTISGNLDAIYRFINTVRPEIRPECFNSQEMETESATPSSGAQKGSEDAVSEPSPKIHKIEHNDILDVQTPFDPEFQSADQPATNDQTKPITYEPISITARPDVPLGAGQEIGFHRTVAVPRGQVAVEFLPWLPKDHPKIAVPPIFRWAAIIHRHPDDPPLKTPAQRRQIFQQAIKKVPYSPRVRGKDYIDRGIYEWSIALG